MRGGLLFDFVTFWCEGCGHGGWLCVLSKVTKEMDVVARLIGFT